MAESLLNGRVTLYPGDCLQVLATLPENSIDSIVTDPPYGLEFMGKEWDSFKTYSGGNPNIKPQGEAIEQAEGWTPGRTFGYRQKNPRCRRCGKLQRGNGSCKCPEPQWDTRTSESAFQFQCFCEDWARACLRVLKPGGHLLAFAAPRNSHRMVCAIEDAGFEIRDSLQWIFGSGFPKSHDVSKGIDKRRDWSALPRLQSAIKSARISAGLSQSEAARRMGLIGPDETLGGGGFMWFETGMRMPTREQWPALKSALSLSNDFDAAFEEAGREITGVADEWSNRSNYAITSKDGFRRDKPATDAARQWEGWGTALKPAYEPICLARKPLDGTVAANVLKHGTGGINVDGCRVEGIKPQVTQGVNSNATSFNVAKERRLSGVPTEGRWPANVLHDGSDEVVSLFPNAPGQSGAVTGKEPSSSTRNTFTLYNERATAMPRGDSGSAARFFYTAKADSDDRAGSKHPTVKPLDLMQYLVRLVTPKGGTVLDPFAGTGTTGEAAWREGCKAVLIEREPEYQEDIRRRMEWALKGPEGRSMAHAKHKGEPTEALPLFGGAA